MKKKIIIISITVCLLLGALWFSIASDILPEQLRKAKKYSTVARIYEMEYFITKDFNTLSELCFTLTVDTQGNNDNQTKEKCIEYYEIMFDESKYKTQDQFNSEYNFSYPAYLSLILSTDDSAKFKSAFESFVDNDITENEAFLSLFTTLKEFSKTAGAEDKQWAKAMAKKIIDGDYIVTDTLERYKEIVAQYQTIIDIV